MPPAACATPAAARPLLPVPRRCPPPPPSAAHVPARRGASSSSATACRCTAASRPAASASAWDWTRWSRQFVEVDQAESYASVPAGVTPTTGPNQRASSSSAAAARLLRRLLSRSPPAPVLSPLPGPLVALLPLLLSSSSHSVAARSCEVVGAAALQSMEAGEALASDGRVASSLARALGSGSQRGGGRCGSSEKAGSRLMLESCSSICMPLLRRPIWGVDAQPEGVDCERPYKEGAGLGSLKSTMKIAWYSTKQGNAMKIPPPVHHRFFTAEGAICGCGVVAIYDSARGGVIWGLFVFSYRTSCALLHQCRLRWCPLR
ncbi:uncharacterized protein LOC119292754 [Triticum dicoccoides]|uniref:uncharacterized protein LOC119292754 n=1 Tax=Triticum dicoccoides TaxID=85692 RepID=UPI00188F5D0A|nr:uncharacterized protein LOC119292754 [Triticum dicoccoides]